MKADKDGSVIFLAKVGGNIKKKRKGIGMSLEELGLEIGLTRMQMHRIEKGYNITLKTLLKICLALEIRPEDLLKVDYKFKKDDLEKLINNNKASKLKAK
jgi:DNA-binding Xre family transcriptional regulator